MTDLTTKDTKNHEKNIGRGYTQINTEVKGERRKGARSERMHDRAHRLKTKGKLNHGKARICTDFKGEKKRHLAEEIRNTGKRLQKTDFLFYSLFLPS
jgi:hypothetical protein